MYSPERQDLPGIQLLRLARGSIEYGLIQGKPLPIDCDKLPRALTELRATFTTLRSKGKLRGCCGTLEASLPLAVDAARSAFQAAYRDSRFDPVGQHEFEDIRLEISVLSPLESMVVTNETDLLEQLMPGTDGLVIIEDWRRATFLPKVWESCRNRVISWRSSNPNADYRKIIGQSEWNSSATTPHRTQNWSNPAS
ncbi:AmmeMemoRadiSam system protein A [Pseudomonadota bacterium]